MSTEQWSLFWSAFGAIGTTLGSMITAIAVVVAVKQYKQPITKLIKVSHGTQFPIYEQGVGNACIFISIKNWGVRPVKISAIYLKAKDKNLFLNNVQTPQLPQIRFPVELQQEEKIDFSMDYEQLDEEIVKLTEQGVIKRKCDLRIMVCDTLGKEYFDKKKIKVRKGKWHR